MMEEFLIIIRCYICQLCDSDCVLQPQASMGQFPAGQPPMYNPQYQQQPGNTVNV